MKIEPLPDRPFLTKDFSDDGGGIDFLGLRLVNFNILASELLPGVNNATRDIGFFHLGAWIPWKFMRICGDNPKGFTQANYDRFRQAIEIVLAEGTRDGSKANHAFGLPNRRIGVGQEISLPGVMAFDKARNKRTEATSMYAAALYGPALRYLGLIDYAKAKDGSATWIHIPVGDAETTLICEHVESRVGGDPLLEKLAAGENEVDQRGDLEGLQARGLHPCASRSVPEVVERASVRKLMGEPVQASPNPRHLTTRLILRTLDSVGSLDAEQMRMVWYTGLSQSGVQFENSDPALEKHRVSWAIFEGRQYQRHILETFLRVFEVCIREGSSSIDAVVERSTSWLEFEPETLAAAIRREATECGAPEVLEEASKWWATRVGGGHDCVDWIEFDEDDPEKGDMERCLRMLARWILRTRCWLTDHEDRPELSWGGESRISIRWFQEWLAAQMNRPLRELLRNLFADLVFTQHLRVALSRLDPGSPKQRLRFMTGDFGIVPTSGMEKRLGTSDAPWMGDRLDGWLLLLKDVGVLSGELNDEGKWVFSRGKNAGWVE